MREAVRIIKDEHTSIAAVLHGLRYLLAESLRTGRPPDFRVLHVMVDYTVAFPERLHHPKEDRCLFRVLRERCPEAGPLLDEIAAEHARGERLLRRLQDTLLAYERDTRPDAAEAFRAAVAEYVDFHWNHINREEHQLLPLAERALTEQDWEGIARAFRENDDPLFGLRPKAEMAELFRRVVNLAPPPIGVGPAAGA